MHKKYSCNYCKFCKACSTCMNQKQTKKKENSREPKANNSQKVKRIPSTENNSEN